ncbi:hypothetical protein P154DRAFT_563939 [Amniculicola lignicola CBS 123094]|uniref:Uncharacterized protein n=1 Tax=Amniculicola lignicola CBS 123094 TaxID=1392246 RepID=A0A6A5WFV1_9PLEO|nr:hypothetical protein P154DRAFT_563939 [Amniculicola lignicola CBS 123094]
MDVYASVQARAVQLTVEYRDRIAELETQLEELIKKSEQQGREHQKHNTAVAEAQKKQTLKYQSRIVELEAQLDFLCHVPENIKNKRQIIPARSQMERMARVNGELRENRKANSGNTSNEQTTPIMVGPSPYERSEKRSNAGNEMSSGANGQEHRKPAGLTQSGTDYFVASASPKRVSLDSESHNTSIRNHQEQTDQEFRPKTMRTRFVASSPDTNYDNSFKDGSCKDVQACAINKTVSTAIQYTKLLRSHFNTLQQAPRPDQQITLLNLSYTRWDLYSADYMTWLMKYPPWEQNWNEIIAKSSSRAGSLEFRDITAGSPAPLMLNYNFRQWSVWSNEPNWPRDTPLSTERFETQPSFRDTDGDPLKIEFVGNRLLRFTLFGKHVCSSGMTNEEHMATSEYHQSFEFFGIMREYSLEFGVLQSYIKTNIRLHPEAMGEGSGDEESPHDQILVDGDQIAAGHADELSADGGVSSKGSPSPSHIPVTGNESSFHSGFSNPNPDRAPPWTLDDIGDGDDVSISPSSLESPSAAEFRANVEAAIPKALAYAEDVEKRFRIAELSLHAYPPTPVALGELSGSKWKLFSPEYMDLLQEYTHPEYDNDELEWHLDIRDHSPYSPFHVGTIEFRTLFMFEGEAGEGEFSIEYCGLGEELELRGQFPFFATREAVRFRTVDTEETVAIYFVGQNLLKFEMDISGNEGDFATLHHKERITFYGEQRGNEGIEGLRPTRLTEGELRGGGRSESDEEYDEEYDEEDRKYY